MFLLISSILKNINNLRNYENWVSFPRLENVVIAMTADIASIWDSEWVVGAGNTRENMNTSSNSNTSSNTVSWVLE